MMKNKKFIVKITVIASIIVFFLIGGYLIYNNYYNNKDNSKQNEINDNKGNKLLGDYKKNIIDFDTYIKYSIYNIYDNDKLDEKYKDSDIIKLNNIIERNLDKLSEETKNLYIHYFSLPNITFNPESESAVAKPLSNNSERDTTNLNKVLLSPNKKALFWYSDTGDDSVELSELEKYSLLIDDTIIKYDSIFNTNYYYNAEVIYKNNRYKDQIKILEDNNIDVNYLTSAINVYVYSFNPKIAGMYCTASSEFLKSSNDDGTILSSYILLNSNSLHSEINSTIQHELFHYYQNYIINNNENKNIVKDDVIGEATAQWAAAKVFDNKSANDNLNLWVTNYLRHTSDIYTEMYNQVGYEIGYALFKILYSYENNVNNGKEKILNSIHRDNGFKYLSENATVDEKRNVMLDLAEKNLSGDYPNKNYLSIDNEKVRTRFELESDGNFEEDFNLCAIGMNYYHVINGRLKDNYKISISSYNIDKLTLAVIVKESNTYTTTLKLEGSNKKITLNTSDISADDFYIVIINPDFISNYQYNIKIEKDTIKNTKVFDTKFENCKIKGESNVSVNGIETISKYEGILDQKHQKEKLIVTTSVFGINVDTESYSDFNSGYSYTKNPLSATWEKTSSSSSIKDLSSFIDILNEKKSNEIKQISPNHYSIKLNSKEARDLFNDDNPENLTFKKDALIDVYIKDGHISKMEYDFTGIINEVEKFHMVLEFYDYNNAGEVLIPTEVLE